MPRSAQLKSVTQTKYYPFNGGLDIVTPALSVDPGFALSMVNFEPWYNGGYRRVDGYERFDGRAKPSNAVVYGAVVSALTGISLGTATGSPGTGVVSGATAQFVEAVTVGGTSWLALTNVSGTFGTGEKILFGTATSTGTIVTAPSLNFAPTGTGTSGFAYLSEFLAQAQNFYRAQIQPVPGTGNVLGAWQLGTNIYAWRGTGTGTAAALMYQATGTGWVAAGTYTTNLYYQGLGLLTAVGTGSVNVQGQVVISAMASGTFTTGMTISDTGGYIPQGATNVQITSGTGGVGTFQLSLDPAMAVPSETIFGLNPTANLPVAGQVVTGASSGATGTLYQAVAQDTSVGYLSMTGVTGTFTNNENLQVSGVTFAQAQGTSSKFAFPHTGFYRFLNANFYANTSSYFIYGVNGQGPAFQIDQNGVIMPILMPLNPLPNQPTTNPFLICAYQNFLFLAFPGGILQQSVQGVPVQFDGFLGAAEFGVGAEITNLHSMVGPNLIIPTGRNTQAISGSSDANFTQATIAEKAGAILNASVLLDTVYALNNLGITSLSRTQSYGNFVGSTISQLVQPMVAALRPFFTDATIVRSSNEARFYFTDGSVLIMYVPGLGQQNKAWSAIETGVTAQFGYANYPAPIFCIYNTEDNLNNEISLLWFHQRGWVRLSGSDPAHPGMELLLPATPDWRSTMSEAPATRKYFRRADLEINSPAQILLKFAADLSYSNQESSSAVANLTASNIPVSNVFGGGGYWDSVNWNQFDWDGQAISTARAQLTGTGENISFLIFHQAIVDTPFILQGLVLYFDPRRLQR